MKSLKDEIGENLDKFNKPAKQTLRNIRDGISDTISDAKADREEGAKPRKRGCIWKAIKWYLIICIACIPLSQCMDDSSSNSVNQNQTAAVVTTETIVETEAQTTLSTEGQPNTKPPVETVAETTPSTEAVVETEAVIDSVPLTEAPEETEAPSDEVFPYLVAQEQYCTEKGIELNRFADKEKELAKWLSTNPNENYYVETDNIFGQDRFKRTEIPDGYIYCGLLEDNRPNGYGILFKQSDSTYGVTTINNYAYDLAYIGEFKDGQFDGFGYQFTKTTGEGEYILHSLCTYAPETPEYAAYYLVWVNYIEYYGEFSKGARSGLGNAFYLSDMLFGLPEKALNEIDINHPTYSGIDVGEFQSNELNGEGKMYISGYLWYEGGIKDGTCHGYGKRYYYGSTQLEYEGDFKNDERHGTGTSYSETGEVIYQGKWRYDDYD